MGGRWISEIAIEPALFGLIGLGLNNMIYAQ